ncbi:MAG: MerR family transcriptional regulator [Candidatus Marinimicrobia bacterium]|nr:MerR family transcriptional regulator [Candidatus Neomarinimicrobiota bacterium]
MEARDIKKLYYSISEVSEITGLKQYVLRYWETEFSQLKPGKNRAGNRIYRSHDVDTIMEIKSLLYDRKFTIKGAQQFLKIPSKKSSQLIEKKKIIKMSNSIDIQTLKDLKYGLDDLIKLVEQFKD